MMAVLAIVATARTDTPAATEFLRVVVALCACAVPVELVEAGAGVGALSREPVLTEDGERYLKGLASNGVVPTPTSDLAARIDVASDVLRLIDPPPPPGAIMRWNEVRDLPDAGARVLSAGVFVRR